MRQKSFVWIFNDNVLATGVLSNTNSDHLNWSPIIHCGIIMRVKQTQYNLRRRAKTTVKIEAYIDGDSFQQCPFGCAKFCSIRNSFQQFRFDGTNFCILRNSVTAKQYSEVGLIAFIV